MKRQLSGFTLIEVSIVLVILGLLLGGVLKGQELITNARLKNLAMDFRNVSRIVHAYQDKYRAIPGDDAGAVLHLGTGSTVVSGALSAVGNGVLDGNWWDEAGLLQTSETVAFWEHVRRANLVQGPLPIANDVDLPSNADGGRIGIESGAPASAYIAGMSGNFVVCSANILGKYAKHLDATMDDGNPFTGAVRATQGAPKSRLNNASCAVAGTPSHCPSVVDDGSTYTVCMAF
ncbi:MAG: prepilin-type N-terminal cleavage/methylation domain-containing protein [Candidatus Accumulibacter sp.]|jgi:prepilin-type N-terminal cleavage/methylation domain-containing protein|nr:prepilin-type N-terminal cleavage/methylation domain-containing protein [Accumulibacter sp.]